MDVLRKYEEASGQKVNIMDVLQNYECRHIMDRHDKYLGLSTVVGHNKGVCFSHIKERLWKRLQEWKGKLLSVAGHELLVKVVAQSIPLYTMYSFLLPKYFCNDLNRSVADFWWSGASDSKKIHWLTWEKLCLPKEESGVWVQKFICLQPQLLGKTGLEEHL